MSAADRKLLELAAKAAGYVEITFTSDSDCLVAKKDFGAHFYWNPADDDGDSRRLEVKLKIELQYVNGEVRAIVCGDDAYGRTIGRANLGHDHLAATRLAVLRAAAAIGEAMP